MKIRTGLRLSAVGVAWLSLASAAFAGEARPYPANALLYSAQTVAASATNQVTIPSGAIVYQISGSATVGDTVVFTPPTGAQFIAPVPTALVPVGTGNCVFTGALNANGTLTYTVTTACNRNTGQLELSLNQAVMTGLSGLASPPGGPATITARGTFAAANAGDSDNSQVSVLTLFSQDTYELFTNPLSPPLSINLSGQAGSTPGTQFDNGLNGISPAGFLGTLRLRARQDLDAATGQPLAAPPAGTLNATISGNFFSLTSAYLVVNGNRASCVATPPAGATMGAINATNSAITFTPPTPAAFPNGSTSWAVCIVSNGTVGGGPVQIPPTPVALGPATVNVLTTSFNLIGDQANTAFGSIVVNGSAAYFQNVFGALNLYPTTFRVANPTGVAAPVFAILTRDGVAGQLLCTNPAALAPGVTPVPANNAAFISADTIAICTTNAPLQAGQQHATVRLLSPQASVLFSSLSQLNGNGGVLSTLP